ncbi:MAG: PKD domain-containing protein [Flavobacteriales bacterium]|nr:PKD domain-containing protein [Flavobacteriales bacterium]
MKRAAFILSLAFLLFGAHSGTAQVTVDVGTDTTTNTTTTYPAPYGQWYTCAINQMLIRASELQSLGLGQGFLTSLGFEVKAANGVALQDFTVKITETTDTIIGAIEKNNLSTVYGPVNYTDVVGWNVHSFTTPFFWDGSSNLIIETCFCNGTGNYTLNARMHYTPTAFNSTVYSITDGDANHCTNATFATASQNRPNMRVVGSPPDPNDAGIFTLSPPPDGCDLSDSEMVSVIVKNFGTDTMFTVDLYYSVDGGAPVIETITDTMPSGAEKTHTFGTAADFSTVGVHTLKAWTVLFGDSSNFNDTNTRQVEHFASVVGFPLFEDFEAQSLCAEQCGALCPLTGNWENDPSSTVDWIVDADGTPVAGTGPSTDHTLGTSSGQYLFASALGCSFTEAKLLGPCMNFDSIANPVLNFFYFMYGSSIGELHVEYDSSGTWVSLMSVIGQQQTGQNDAWIDANIDLAQVTGITRLRIRAVTGLTSASDIAIDDILLYNKMPDDVGVTAVVSPTSGCELSVLEPITITIKNYGIATQTSIPVAYSVDGGAPVVETISTVLTTFSSMNYAFTTPANLSAFGPHTISAWTQLSGDAVLINDSMLNLQIENFASTSSFPFEYDVDSETLCSTTCGDACTLTGGWENVTTDDIDWAVDAGGTGSTNTGPAVDNTLGSPVGQYLYTEASGCSFSEAILLSPCLDMPSLPNPALNFYYHMYGSNMGELHVEIDSNGVWISLFTVIGQVQTLETDPWVVADLNLPVYPTGTRIRIRGVTGNSFQSDLAIDDIRIFSKTGRDVGVLSIDAPTGSCLSASEGITVSVENFGAQEQDTVPVSYSIDGGAPVTETIYDTISPGEVYSYTFSTTADLSAVGPFKIVSWTSLPGDSLLANDTTIIDSLPNSSTIANFEVGIPISCQGSPTLFNDLSTNSPIAWIWDFGNGDSSSVQNPSYVYNDTGIYSVTLVAANICSSDTILITDVIQVSLPPKLATCDPTVTDINNEVGIRHVIFNTINNNTDTLREGYTEYGCNYFTTILSGSSQTLSVTTGPSWPENVRAWIDYNSDGTFTTNELVMISNNIVANHSVSFIVQEDVLDTLLRMRIASEYAILAVPGPAIRCSMVR